MMYMEFEEDLLDRIKKITNCNYYAKAKQLQGNIFSDYKSIS